MALLDRFKKSKIPSVGPKRGPAMEKLEAQAPPASFSKGERRVLGMVLVPHITEKTTGAHAHGWYAFRVPLMAGKIGVKQAVEDRYRVRVERVRMSRIRPRKVRIGGRAGIVPGFKKAMVRLGAGESIEFT